MGNEPIVVEGPKKTPKEIIKEQKRKIQRSIRNIEKEKRTSELNLKKMKLEIKKMVEKGQTTAAKMLAKDIVRLKTQSEKLTQFSGQLKAVEIRVSSLSSLNELQTAMEEAGKAIMTVSTNLDANKLNTLAKQLMMEDAKLDMKSEMMGEILDGMGSGMDDESQSDEIYNQVLEECGIKVKDQMVDAGKTELKKEEAKVEESDSLDALLKQLQG